MASVPVAKLRCDGERSPGQGNDGALNHRTRQTLQGPRSKEPAERYIRATRTEYNGKADQTTPKIRWDPIRSASRPQNSTGPTKVTV